MKTIQQKLGQVIRRVFLQQLVARLPWFLFAFLMLAVVAFLVPRLVHWQWIQESGNQRIWENSWAWGAGAAGLLLTLVACWWSRINPLQAAEQLDQRFELQQRTSSVLRMANAPQDGGFYAALVNDTERKVGQVEVPEQFPIRSRWPLVMPLIPLMMLLGMNLVPLVAAPEVPEDQLALEESTKKQLTETIRKASNKTESERDLEKEMEATRTVQLAMEKAEKELSKNDITKKEAMVAINDVKKAIEDQQKKLGQADALKDRLQQLKEQIQGPADKMTEAMKEGKFGEAAEQIKKLAEKIAKGELSKEDQEKLGQQMEQMKKQMDQIKKEFENRKQDLERQIQNAAAEGDLQRAADLQQQKEQLEQQQRQMDQMQQLGQQCEKIGNAMKQAQDGQMNQQQMQELQNALEQMQQQMQDMDLDAQQMEQLQEMMQKMEQMKQNMKDGPGKMQFNFGQGNKGEGPPGNGLGEGEGKGNRPEEDDGDGKFYDSEVKPDVKPGEVARIGKVGGANRKGTSRAEIESALKEAAQNTDLTPDELQSIPYNQREHVRDYFKKLRDQ